MKQAYRELYDLVLDRNNTDIGAIPKAFATSHGSLFTDTFGKLSYMLIMVRVADG